MFSFFKRTNFRYKDYAHLQTDMHSHLIPGIDDGAKTMEDSIAMIRRLIDLGYQKIITTPHIMGEYYPNTPDIIQSGLANLREALKKEGLTIEVDAAAEYFVDEFFENLLNTESPLLTLPKNRILIEVSMMEPPRNLAAILFELNTRSYQPILAHPERYTYYADKVDKFADLKDKGCTLQLNLLSLTGHYGKIQKKLGLQLLKAGLIDFVGTDMHNLHHADILQKALKDKSMLQMLNKHNFANPQL